MNKNIIIGIIAAVLILSAIAFFAINNSSDSQQATDPIEDDTIGPEITGLQNLDTTDDVLDEIDKTLDLLD